MARNSKIEWTDHTVNPWWGCTCVNAACENCYAEVLSKRWGFDIWGRDKPRRYIKSAFKTLEKFQREAEKAGVIYKIFLGSMMDIFELDQPLSHNEGSDFKTTGQLRDKLFREIQQGLYPNLTFLFLTKRPSNIIKMIPQEWMENPPMNVMFGTSVYDQDSFNTYVKQLRKAPGRKFLSIEPQLDLIYGVSLEGIDWIIQGGESGHGRRPFRREWVEEMIRLCRSQNVPYFFKQIDKVIPIPESLLIREFPRFYLGHKRQPEFPFDFPDN